jgi:glycosyltransferase involved in cell wall biosynthesis
MVMKIAIVVQRYGTDVIGGAETLARQVAEKLALKPSWVVDVITTTARDYQTWDNHYREGRSVINGVTVHRFNSAMGRSRLFPYLDRLLATWALRLQKTVVLKPLACLLELLWLLLQGPFNPKIARYIRSSLHDYDKVFFYTYLYLPTVWGIHTAKEKSVLIPMAHDERPFHFLMVRKALDATSHILANSVPEQELVAASGIPRSKISIAGLGIDGVDELRRDSLTASPSPEAGDAGRKTYVLYLGRVSKGKQLDRLVWLFERFRQAKGHTDVSLLLAGRKDDNLVLPESANVKYMGFLPEDMKAAYIAHASCLVNPSSLESLSLIVLEAMALEVPVLVNTASPTLEYYTQATRTVYGYHDEDSFSKQLDYILRQDWRDATHSRDLEESRRWVIDNYSWEKVLGEYERIVGSGSKENVMDDDREE